MDEFSNSSIDFLITTVDNPYSPFTEPDEWQKYDMINGYNTWSTVCSIADLSPDLSDHEKEQNYVAAMLEVLRLNPCYIKVFRHQDEEKIKKFRELMLSSVK